MNPWTARQRLGLRQSSGAFGWLASIARAPEDWGTAPKPGGAFNGSWRAHWLFRMHWDHEPADRAVASWTAPVLWRFRLARLHCQSARGLAQSKTLPRDLQVRGPN